MTRDKKFLIIGVSNVDAQVKEQHLLAQARQNQVVYSRLMSLSGDYLCIYIINPKDNSYIEFQATSEFQSIGVKNHEGDFFADTQINADVVVKEEDYCKRAVELGHTTVFTTNHGVQGFGGQR